MGCLLPHAGWWFLGSLLLVAPQQGTSWYKHSASPRYHTVGRASGLLIGVRRSPYLWRREVSGDNYLDVQQVAPEGRDVIQGKEEDADTRYPQYPGQEGVRRLIEERFPWKTEEDKSGEMNRGIKEQREEERSLEEIRRGVQLQEQERSLEEIKRGVQVPGEDEMMSLSETKRIQEPGQGGINMEEVTGRLKIPEGGQDKSLEASEVTILMPGERKLHYQQENWSHSQPWRRQPSAEYQANSRPTELLNCDDFTSTFYKVLCKGGLRVLSRSQLRLRSQRPEVERPGSPL